MRNSMIDSEFTSISILTHFVLTIKYQYNLDAYFFNWREISGQFFHRPNIVRIDSDYDDVDILKQSVISSTSTVCASVKVPLYPGSWMLKVSFCPASPPPPLSLRFPPPQNLASFKVRNFDDPNLDSEDYLRLNFQSEEPITCGMHAFDLHMTVR